MADRQELDGRKEKKLLVYYLIDQLNLAITNSSKHMALARHKRAKELAYELLFSLLLSET